MNFYKIILINFIFFIIMIGAVSAADNMTMQDTTGFDKVSDDKIIQKSEDILADSSWDSSIDLDKSKWDISTKHVDFYVWLPADYTPPLDESKGNFTISMEGSNYTNIIDYGSNYIKIKGPEDLSVGKHNYTAIFSGDDAYPYSTQNYSFNVLAPMTVNFDDSWNYSFDEFYEIYVDLIDYYDANMTVLIDNKLYYNQMFDPNVNNLVINIADLACGRHDIEVIYGGNNEFPRYSVLGNFTINYLIDLDVSEFDECVCGNTKLAFKIPSFDMNSEFVITIDGNRYSYYGVDGLKLLVDGSNLLPGEHNIVVTYMGDDKFPKASFNRTFSVDEPKIKESFQYSYDVSYGNNEYIYLFLPENAQGSLVVEIYDLDTNELIKNQTSKLVNGKAYVYLSDLKKGFYRYDAYYTGKDYDVDTSGSFEVNYYVSGPISDEHVFYLMKMDSQEYISVKLPYYYSGDLTVNIYNVTHDNSFIDFYKDKLINSISAKLVNGEAKIKIPNNVGFYYIEGIYTGTAVVENYEGFIYVGPLELTIPEKISYNQSNNLTVNFLNDASGTVLLEISKYHTYDVILKSVTADVVGGVASFDLSKLDLDYDLYFIKLFYNGNYGNGELFSDDLMFNIREETCTIVGDENHHDLIINSPGNEGNVSVYVDGKLFAVEQLIGGKAVIHINDLTFGNHIISTYINDSPMWYDADQELFIKKDSKLSSSSNNPDTNSNLIFTVNMDKFASGNVIVEIDGKHFSANILNGVANVDCGRFAAGTYRAKIYYSGNDYFYKALGDLTAVVTQGPVLNPKIVADNKVVYYSDGSLYYISVYDKFSDPVRDVDVVVKIGSYSVKLKTDVNGVTKLAIPNKLAPNKYTVVISALGVNVKKSLTIKHILKLKKVKVKKSAKKLVIKASLKIAKKPLAGKKIALKFNGKKYKAKTSKKGIAKFTIKKAALNKLKVGKKVSYKAKYLKDTVKNVVKVKK